MHSVVSFINETVKSFESEHNLGRESQKDMLAQCRPAAETYIFGKLFKRLFGLYLLKHGASDSEFCRVQKIIRQQDPKVIIKFLGVNDKFIFESKPYATAIKELEKISSFESPVEMVTQLSLCYARLKSEVVDYHKGKLELESMDDVLPLTIYCVAMAELEHPASYLGMMQDYLRQVNGYDLERKLLCNFDCAVQYVSR